jgi:hypothetical protein
MADVPMKDRRTALFQWSAAVRSAAFFRMSHTNAVLRTAAKYK